MSRNPYYGIVGNGETCALVSPKGSIEWLCLPRFDGKIIYSKALDPVRGEALDIKILEDGKEPVVRSSAQRYVSRTAVLQTVMGLGSLTAEITDFMPFNQDSVFRTNQRLMFRIIKIKNDGRQEAPVQIKIYSGISTERHKDVQEGLLLSDKVFIGSVFYGLQEAKIPPKQEWSFSFALVYGTDQKDVEREMRRLKNADPQKELQSCIGFWINWFDRGKPVWLEDQDFLGAYTRSLMTIKLLTYHKTGAMVAAPTASFPATPGGTENWDYRYAWIRDCYFAMRALLRSGHYEEVKQMLYFFYGLQGSSGHWGSPLYAIDGKGVGKEIIVEELTGPNEENRIRIGNAASAQLQLDGEGSVLHATYLYYLFTEDDEMLRKNWQKIKKAADWISRNHNRKESGIWESRSEPEHYTYGKVMCYVGLESASKIAAVTGKRNEWKQAREKLKKHIVRNAWSDQRQSFLQTLEKDAPIDISVLAIEDYGILKPDDARMKKTVRLMESKLVQNSTVMRYENAALPFYLPTLWLASHYIRSGKRARGEELIRSCISSATDLYLVSEHFDPQHGMQYGNFPQAFNAAMLVEQILNLKEKRSMFHLLNIFNLDAEYLKKIFFFDRHRLIEESEKFMGFK